MAYLPLILNLHDNPWRLALLGFPFHRRGRRGLGEWGGATLNFRSIWAWSSCLCFPNLSDDKTHLGHLVSVHAARSPQAPADWVSQRPRIGVSTDFVTRPLWEALTHAAGTWPQKEHLPSPYPSLWLVFNTQNLLQLEIFLYSLLIYGFSTPVECKRAPIRSAPGTWQD